MQNFKKKPVVVQAMQWIPQNSFSKQEVLEVLSEHGVHFKVFEDNTIGVGTLESGDEIDRHRGKPGDFIIKGIQGEFYVCDQEVFWQTYERA